MNYFKFEPKILNNDLNNKNILITGGTGSFGNKMTEVIVNNYKPNKLIIFSRDEYKQHIMSKKFSINKYPFIRYFIGDIRDRDRLNMAFKNIDIIFHAAALKHVTAIEYNPIEAVKTNIYGTENVIMEAIKNNVKKVIAISTDKCVTPVNMYGATKLCLEKMIINANVLSGNNTKFSVLRYGNVLGSRGSVVPIFKELHKNNKILTITDKRMTRFTMTLDDAINFVLICMYEMIGGEIFVPKIPSYNILQVVNIINKKNLDIKTIGKRPGEKLHEMMISDNEAYLTIDNNNKFVIMPHSEVNDHSLYINKYGNNICNDNFSYTSNENNLIDNKILELLINQL